MSYIGEFRLHWRALAAASVGLAFGYTFNNYVTNVFSPHLIAEFGWKKSEFALLGLIIIVAVICQPIAGRLADIFGVRRIALIGVIGAPLLFLALSQMSGSFTLFFGINILQVILVGSTTSVVVYTRLIAREFSLARGVALGIAASAPAVCGAFAAPIMASFIEQYGWRTGYVGVAATVAVMGLCAIALIPSGEGSAQRGGGEQKPPAARAPIDYRLLVRDRAFQLIMAGMLLCNLTITLQMTQISILLQDIGVSARTASFFISMYAVGVVAGRLLCGVALDRFAPHIVSAVAMSAPALGLFILASGTDAQILVALAISVLGLSLGAEGDVGAYLVMRYFDASIYSSVVGLVLAALSVSGVIGTLLLSGTLELSGNFRLFLLISGVSALIGGLLFLLLRYDSGRQTAALAQ